MALNSKIVLLAGLIELQLVSRTIRLCDGGFVNWPARGMFTSSDVDFGTIESLESISEGLGDEAPGARLTLLPTSTAEAGALFQSNAQGRPILMWLAEVDRSTGLLVGTPQLMFTGMIDSMKIAVGKAQRKVDIEFVAAAERLFLVREGNVLSPRFHQDAWPGEKGFNHCTANAVSVPWGVTGPPRGVVYVGGGGGGGGSAAVAVAARITLMSKPRQKKPVPDLIRRNNALQATMMKFAGKELRLGEADCAKLVRFHLVKMGHRRLPKATGYSSPGEAKEVLKAMGFKNLEELFDSLLPRITPAFMLPGDIALVKAERGAPAWQLGTVVISIGRQVHRLAS